MLLYMYIWCTEHVFVLCWSVTVHVHVCVCVHVCVLSQEEVRDTTPAAVAVPFDGEAKEVRDHGAWCDHMLSIGSTH